MVFKGFPVSCSRPLDVRSVCESMRVEMDGKGFEEMGWGAGDRCRGIGWHGPKERDMRVYKSMPLPLQSLRRMNERQVNYFTGWPPCKVIQLDGDDVCLMGHCKLGGAS